MSLRKRIRPWWIVGAVVLLIGAGVTAWTLSGSKPAHFRTTLARYASLNQTIATSGNITPTNEVNLGFGVSGQVATLNATVGQNVTQGSVLAQLDPTTLDAQLSSAQASLAAAQAKLAEDEAGSPAQAIVAAQGSVNSAQTALASAQTNLSDTNAINAQQLTAAQNAVNTAQSTVNADQAAETSACTTSSTSTSSSSSPACSTSQATLSGAQTALQTAQSQLSLTETKNQQATDQAQAQVNSASNALANAQANLVGASQPAPATTIAADNASVQAAQAQVALAQHNISQAQIVAPFSGTIGAVNISIGQSTNGSGNNGSTSSQSASNSSTSSSTATSSSAGSSGSSSATSTTSPNTAAIVLVDTTSFQVSTLVSDAEIAQVKTGDAALITPAGSTKALPGTVSAVGPLATVTQGVATFPVTINITGNPSGLFAGASAQVSIVVSQVSNVLTVPAAALHTYGSHSFVYVLAGKKEVRHIVKTGATDGLRTQIISGLSPGQAVVLANLNAPLPTGLANPLGGKGGGKGGALAGFTGGGGGGKSGGGRAKP